MTRAVVSPRRHGGVCSGRKDNIILNNTRTCTRRRRDGMMRRYRRKGVARAPGIHLLGNTRWKRKKKKGKIKKYLRRRRRRKRTRAREKEKILNFSPTLVVTGFGGASKDKTFSINVAHVSYPFSANTNNVYIMKYKLSVRAHTEQTRRFWYIMFDERLFSPSTDNNSFLFLLI